MIREAVEQGPWQAADGVSRSFVRHRNPDPSPATYFRYRRGGGQPQVSIIIPTTDAKRGDYFHNLLRQIEAQTIQNLEILVIKGDGRQGRAINIGAALADAKYLVTFDDDTSLPQYNTLELLVDILERHADIGIAGGNAVIPPNAPAFVARVMTELPRRAWSPVAEITESDLAQHPCLIIRTEEFKSIGGENELIPRGLDPYLREEFRKAGKRVVLVPGVIYYHLPPSSWGALLSQFRRNGRHAAYVNRNYPQWVIETPAKHGEFRRRLPLAVRVVRLPARLLSSLFRFQVIRVLCEFNYAIGFASGWLFRQR